MKKYNFILIISLLMLFSGLSYAENIKNLSAADLKDKIAGGWAGKMIGVSFGAPTEFRALGATYKDDINWGQDSVKNSLYQDDLYVQLSFMMAMDKYGIDAPVEKIAESLATARFCLWHANLQGRKNFLDGIMPPESGNPKYNIHADDIDFQIECDFIGFISPGLPQASNDLADKIGHIMNYGDGVYGGMFVAAMYTAAFFEKDIDNIVEIALLSIPKESDYSKCIRDVIKLKKIYPDDWQVAWSELDKKWGDVDICGAVQPFNIDAKINGAYIVMGLLYGGGDFEKTMEISTRCGQDSDCNPSNAAAVIGVISGYEAIPEKWKAEIPGIADSTFLYTNYTFNSAVTNSMKYALENIKRNGGKIENGIVEIPVQKPKAPRLEVSFPQTVPSGRKRVSEDGSWEWKGMWSDGKIKESANAGDEAIFTFIGTGVSINGSIGKEYGKADIYIDGVFDRSVDNYYTWDMENDIWHKLGLNYGTHKVRIVVKGEKNKNSGGSKILLTETVVFQTGIKKNEKFRFSFEK